MNAEPQCQLFQKGCCGCCVNLNKSRGELDQYLHANTDEAESLGTSPRRMDLVRWHWRRGGFWDHLLGFWLVPFTFGLSAWWWKRRFGSCCFAGFLDPERKRVGCLLHPLRLDSHRDWRKWAFPLVPTLRCNRGLICGVTVNPENQAYDWLKAGRLAMKVGESEVADLEKR